MEFDSNKLVEWLADHSGRQSEESYHARVLGEIDDEDYPLAALQLCECRRPAGIRVIDQLLDGCSEGLVDLHRVWRYHAYSCHICARDIDWVNAQLAEGKPVEFEPQSLWLQHAAYAIACGIVLGENGFTEWAGKRTVAGLMRPDEFGPVFWNREPIVPFVLGLFTIWAHQMADTPIDENTLRLIDHLAAQCASPYAGGVLTDWEKPSFDSQFNLLCDKWGQIHDEPIPFNGIPIAIIATIKIRRSMGLPVPDHALLQLPVVTIPLDCENVQSVDAFFDDVNRKVSTIAPDDTFAWPW